MIEFTLWKYSLILCENCLKLCSKQNSCDNKECLLDDLTLYYQYYRFFSLFISAHGVNHAESLVR